MRKPSIKMSKSDPCRTLSSQRRSLQTCLLRTPTIILGCPVLLYSHGLDVLVREWCKRHSKPFRRHRKSETEKIADPKRKANHKAGSCDRAAVWIPLGYVQKGQRFSFMVLSAKPRLASKSSCRKHTERSAEKESLSIDVFLLSFDQRVRVAALTR